MQALGFFYPLPSTLKTQPWNRAVVPSLPLTHVESKGPGLSVSSCFIIRLTFLQEAMLHFLKLEHILKLFKYLKKAKKFRHLRKHPMKYT